MKNVLKGLVLLLPAHPTTIWFSRHPFYPRKIKAIHKLHSPQSTGFVKLRPLQKEYRTIKTLFILENLSTINRISLV